MKLAGSALKDVQRYLPREIQTALRETVRKVEKYAIMRAPVGATKATRAGIHGRVLSATEGEVGTNQEAAMAIDQGAKPHLIKPKTAKALAIPEKDTKGRYTSKSKKTKRGKAKKFKTVHYKDVSGAPNKRHLDVEFAFVRRAHHPGSRAQPFLTPAAMIANRVATDESNKAVIRSLKRANKG